MAAPEFDLRLVFQKLADTNGVTIKKIDSDVIRSTGLPGLAGFAGDSSQQLTLASGASDQALTFTDALAVLIVSRDNPFQLRLAAGEVLLANLSAFLVYAQDTATGVLQTSVLLSGNGATASVLEFWVIEKP